MRKRGLTITWLYVRLKNLLSNEEGQGLVEYAMIIGLVALGVFVLLGLMGKQVEAVFRQITGDLAAISGVRAP